MPSPITAVTLSPSSTQLAVATPESLYITRTPPPPSPDNPPDPLPLTTPHNLPNITSLTLPSSDTLYTATSTGTVTRYSLPLKQTLCIKAAHSTHPLTSIAALSPTTVFATAAKDGLVKLWDPATATPISKLSAHRYEVRSLALATSFDQDTPITLIASAGRDKTIRLWDSRLDTPVATLKGHSGWVHSVALANSPSPIAVSCGGDKTVRVWDLLTMSERHLFTGHEYRVWDVAVPAYAKYCISASTDATVRAWEIGGSGRKTFEAHNDSVLCVAAARDGRFVVSGCEDGTVLVWGSRGLFGHRPNDDDLVEHPTTVETEVAVKPDDAETAGQELVDVGGHVGTGFDGVPRQMDTTPLVTVDAVEQVLENVQTTSEELLPTPVQQSQSTKLSQQNQQSISAKSKETLHKNDTESLKAVIAAAPEQAPSYDKSAAELVKALQRISELEKCLRDANDAALIKDRELSALKSSLQERDTTIARLKSEVETSKALVHEAGVRALLDQNPRKTDVALDYDEPVNKIGAVSDKLTRLAARLDAMIATN